MSIRPTTKEKYKDMICYHMSIPHECFGALKTLEIGNSVIEEEN